MLSVLIKKSGTPITSFQVPDDQTTFVWSFETYTIELSRPMYYQHANYQYVPNPTSGHADIATAVRGLATSLEGWPVALAEMIGKLREITDRVTAQLERERNYWRDRAQSLEIENQLLRSEQ